MVCWHSQTFFAPGKPAAIAGLRNSAPLFMLADMSSPSNQRQHGSDAERQAESRRILASVNAENSVSGLSARLAKHFSGADADQNDPMEVLGRRIGRGLSLILCAVLIIWLLRFLGFV
jgi:hypothetical protein